jgi:hypothetical protein
MHELTKISKPFKSPSQRDMLEAVLTTAVTMRGAKLDKETLSLYSGRLLRESFDDVVVALEKIAEMPREQYETALPDMGTVLDMVRIAGQSRANRAEAAKDVELIGWQCKTCRRTMSGFHPREENAAAEVKYCRFGARREGAKLGEICGGDMTVIHRGPAGEAA